MIDLRSDTVTKPTAEMRAAIAGAEVGDDVYGEDPTVNRLERLSAEMLGKESALFLPTGTQANLVAVMTHCRRGDEFIVGRAAHVFHYEAGGAAALGSAHPHPLDFAPDGTLDLDEVAAAIRPTSDHFDPLLSHFAPTRLLCLENTQDGKVVPLDYLAEARSLATARGLAVHLDGARLFNAAAALGVAPAEIAKHADTVSFCLSKGLGAPAGSMLCGPSEQLHVAHHHRKILGGGMRQVGVLAAAGCYALEHNLDRLADDHRNAERLALGLDALDGFAVDMPGVQTNMVFLRLTREDPADFAKFMAERGIAILVEGPVIRLVTHLDVTAQDVERVIASAEEFVS
ncbi:MAG: low-specificity L-threonine aldolase [Actinobacteria bacterium]|nr:MAG: low-specificity L-threonine aldolase [Actinomycetota bacterium]RIK08220.1 MAG: low-specificity L-threonine aldolase [Acidobacteriota bacterium]